MGYLDRVLNGNNLIVMQHLCLRKKIVKTYQTFKLRNKEQYLLEFKSCA